MEFVVNHHVAVSEDIKPVINLMAMLGLGVRGSSPVDFLGQLYADLVAIGIYGYILW